MSDARASILMIGVVKSMATDPHRFDDLFAEFGPITLRRFFGGEGIRSGDVMFGMIFDDRIYFKTDEGSRKLFLAEKCKPFSFEKKGETIVTTWYALPDRLYDDPDELAQWARTALDVAAASPTTTKKARKTPGLTRPRKSR